MISLLHVPTTDTWLHVLEGWVLSAGPVGLLLAAGAGYALAYRTGRRMGRSVPTIAQAAGFFTGLAVLAVALVGPVEHLSAQAFSVHMIQHLLLVLVGAPLIASGRPVQVVLRGLPPGLSRRLVLSGTWRRSVRQVLPVLVHPLSVTLFFNASLVAWHLPPLFQAAVRVPALHALEHLMLFGGALLFWWVVIDPTPRHLRLSSSAALFVLFVTWMASDVLCATITLAREVWYPVYAGALSPWGLSPHADQRLGGLIMWVSSGLFYPAVMIWVLAGSVGRRRPRPAEGVVAQRILELGAAGREPAQI